MAAVGPVGPGVGDAGSGGAGVAHGITGGLHPEFAGGAGGPLAVPIALRNSFSETTTRVGVAVGNSVRVATGVVLVSALTGRVTASVGAVETPARPDVSRFDAAEPCPMPK